MKKIFKWSAIILSVIILVAILAIAYFYTSATNRLNKAYALKTEMLEIPTDSASIARGKHLSFLCQECHGNNLGGVEFFNDPALAVINTPNLTSGEGGIGSTYNHEDWIRAIRHGVHKDSKPLFVMSSEYLNNLSKPDLAALIAYLNQLPPVNNSNVFTKYGFMGKVLIGAGAFGPKIISAEVIDHDKPIHESHPAEEETVAYGNYLISIAGCGSCHHDNFGGQVSPDPNSPYVPCINKAGNFGKWSKESFIKTFRTGITPEGKNLDVKFMPFATINKLSDMELGSIYLYLNSLEPIVNPKD